MGLDSDVSQTGPLKAAGTAPGPPASRPGVGGIEPLVAAWTAASGGGMSDVAHQMKHGALSVFDGQLGKLWLQATPHALELGAGVSAFATSVQDLPNSMKVIGGVDYVNIDVVAADGDASALLPKLEAVGLRDGAAYKGLASGAIAVHDLAALRSVLAGATDARSDDLGFARSSGLMLRTGTVTTQADAAEHADTARTSYGVDGSGVTVGIISDSFNTSGGAFDYAQDLATGNLGAVGILADSPGGTDEGRAMAELVHDLAPGSPLLFATAYNNQAQFAQHIVDLATGGATVITDDVIYFAELAYQQGPIAQAVNKVTTQFGVTYFSAAGNDADGAKATGFEGAWVPGNTYSVAGVTETLMRFAPGQDYIPVTLAAGETFVLQWANPGASAGGPGATADLDLFLTDQSGATVYLTSLTDNTGGDPVEVMGVSGGQGGTYYLRVGLADGPAPPVIRLMILANGRDAYFTSPASNTNTGAFYGHAAASGALAVGAAAYSATPAFGVNPALVENYSSRGVDKILFDDQGNLTATPSYRSVAFTAADGGNTAFFGHDDGDADALPNFYGTSAAAPDAAAVAALMLQARPGLTPTDIANLLKDSASDMDVAGPDLTTGAGLINADLAVGFAKTLAIANASQLVLLGTHFDDAVNGGTGAESIDGGAGNDQISSGGGADTIDGGPGSDTLTVNDAGAGGFGSTSIARNAAGSLSGVVDGVVSFANFETLNLTLGDNGTKAYVGISALTSGAKISLDGGAGPDTLVIDLSPFAGTSFNATAPSVVTTVPGLVVKNFETYVVTLGGGSNVVLLASGNDQVTGGSGDESIFGGSGADTLGGAGGADTIEGGVGTDKLDGGTGMDTVSYEHATAGVNVDLTLAAAQNTGGAGVDTLSGFENIVGSGFNDVLRAGTGDHTIQAGAGNDLVYADAGTSVLYDGGTGSGDTVSFGFATHFVNVSLAVTAPQSTGTGVKTILNFENLVGSTYGDNLSGDGGSNVLTGGGGGDTLAGGAGADTFRYLQAADSIVATPDLIKDFAHGIDKVDLTAIRTGVTDTYGISTVGANTQLDVDLHGDGTIDLRIRLVGQGVLTAGDLIW